MISDTELKLFDDMLCTKNTTTRDYLQAHMNQLHRELEIVESVFACFALEGFLDRQISEIMEIAQQLKKQSRL